MAKVSKTVELSKEMHELVSGLVDIALIVKANLEDGVSGDDVANIALPALGKLVPMLQGVDQLDEEWEEDKAALLLAAMEPLPRLIDGLLSKPVAEPGPVA